MMDEPRRIHDEAAPKALKPLDKVEISLAPDEIEVTLRARPLPEPPQSLWHRVKRPAGVTIAARSRDTDIRIVRLTVKSAAPGWNSRWVRWTYPVRRAPELLGGDAISAQDVLSEDGAALNLLLLPDERRTVTLEFTPILDGETAPGDYPFAVHVMDAASGDSSLSPGMLRLSHPPSEFIAMLPSIYAGPSVKPRASFEQYVDPPFFTRFLRGFEDAREPLSALLERRERFFDLREAPPDFLPWLATWVSLALDENWPELKRRRLIREAVDLYRWRGTRVGLSRYLEIYTGVIPQIEDQPFAGMRLSPDTLLGSNTILGGVSPHCFVVTLAVTDPRAVNEQIVRDIIESEKPAHAAYDLRIVHRLAGDD